MVESLTYSVDEAAEAIGIGRSKLYNLLRRDDLPAIHVGRRILIPREAVREFLGLRAISEFEQARTPVSRRSYLVTVTEVTDI